MKRIALQIAAALTLAGAGMGWAEVPLPADYTPLSYIDASGTQYLRTGVNVQGDTSLEISFGKFRPYHGSSVFEQDAWADTCRLGADANGRFEFGTTTAQLPEIDPAADYVVTVGGGKLTIAKDGGTPVEVALASITGASGTELALFARNNGGDNRAACRFYGMRIWDGRKTLLRDFIPCRKPSGEAGLWDSVSGAFFGNSMSGSRFYTEDDALTCVRSIKQKNKAYIDTGYKPNQDTCIEMDLTVGGAYETWFGAAAKDGDWWKTKAFALANDKGNLYVGFGNWSGTCVPILPTGWQGTVRLSKAGFQIRDAGQVEWTTKLAVVQGDFTADQTLYLCANNTHPSFISKTNQGMSFSGVRVYENGVLVHEYLPACEADGTVGVCDSLFDNAFFPTIGIDGCTQFFFVDEDLAYLKQGNALVVHKGTLRTADLTGVSAVEKTSAYAVDASAVTGYPALTLSAGAFSLADNAAAEYGVTGALTVKGGARLAIDVTADGCDRLAVGSLVLDETLTAETPFTIEVNAVGVSGLAEPRALVTGGGLAAEDAAKFRLVGFPAVLGVVNGDLMMMKASEGTSVWTGHAGDGKWSTADNWENLEVPAVGAVVKFVTSAGGATTCDIANLSLKSVVFEEGAGAFTIAGAERLAVLSAITNAAAATQTFAVPLALGANASFDLACAGEVNLHGSGSLAGDLAKSGAGTLRIDEELIASGRDLVIAEGRVIPNHTGNVTSAATAGEIRVAHGAQLDVDLDHGDVESLAKSEAIHGKTIRIAGDGPDGRGAVLNTNASVSWGSTAGRIVLDDDASAGGNYFAIRPLANSRIPGSSIEGPHTFTVRNSLKDTGMTDGYYRAFVFRICTFALDRLDIRGAATFESTQSGTVTNGVHLYDGSTLGFYNIQLPEEGFDIVAEEGSSAIRAGGSYETIVSGTKGSLTLKDGTTLNVYSNPSKFLVGKDVAIGAGATLALNDTESTLKGTISGSGRLTGAKVSLAGNDTCLKMAADDTGFTEKVDLSGVTTANFLTTLKAIDVTYAGTTSQTLEIGPAFGLTTDSAKANVALRVHDVAGEPIGACGLEVAEGRLVLNIRYKVRVARATWAGGADSALDDFASWSCFDDDGNPIPKALPMEATTVTLPDGCVFNCTNGAPFACAKLIAPKSIGGDCDWSGVSCVTINETLNIGGHVLKLSGFEGAGKITGGGYEAVDTLVAPPGSYFDTEVHARNQTRVVAVFDVHGAHEYWFGAWDGAWNDRAYALGNDGGGVYIGYGTGGGTAKPLAANGVRTVELRGVDESGWKAQLYIDGVFQRTVTAKQAIDLGSTLYLFAQHRVNEMYQPSSQGSLYFKGCQIYDGAKLIRDYVPVRRLTDGVVGVLDLVNGNCFHGSDGTVAFTADGTYEPQASGGEVQVGEVQFVVDAGKTLVNETLPVEGLAKVVKKGAGTYVNKVSHRHLGGTVVEEGLYQAFNDGTGNYAFDKFRHLGVPGSTVEVAKGATFDIRGNHGLCEHPVVLSGGTLATTGYSHLNEADSTGLGNLTLTADSFIDARKTFLLRGSTDLVTRDLGGHTLTCTSDANVFVLVRGYGFSNGTFRAVGAGLLTSTWQAADLSDATLEIGGNVKLSLFADMTVGTLRVSTGTTTYSSSEPDWRVNILDRYVPVTDGIFAFRFGDGVVLDLSERDAALDATGKTFEFASDAKTVLVDLGARKVKSSEPLVTWGAKPANVKFRAVPGTVGRFTAKDDGLYRSVGLGIIVR